MSYTKHNYQSNDPLYAFQLNEMDNQIAQNETTNASLAQAITQVNNDIDTMTGSISSLTTKVNGFSNGAKVLAIGDSYSWGTGGTMGKGWPYYLKQLAGDNTVLTLVHQNGGGFACQSNTSATYPSMTYVELVDSLDASMVYDYIVVQTGWNDANRGTVATIKSGVDSFVSAIRAKYPNSVLVILPVYCDIYPYPNQAIRLMTVARTAMENNVKTCFDSIWWLQNSGTNSTTETVGYGHPNDAGYQLLAKYIYQFLNGWSGYVDFQKDISSDMVVPTITGLNWADGPHLYVTKDMMFLTGSIQIASSLPNGFTARTNIITNLPLPAISSSLTFDQTDATKAPIRLRIHTTQAAILQYGVPGTYVIHFCVPLKRFPYVVNGVEEEI